MDQRPDLADDPTAMVLVHLAELRGVADDAWSEGTIVDLGLRFHRLRVLETVVHNLVAMVEHTLVDSMETDIVEVPGTGRLFREERVSSAWKSKHSPEQLREDLTTAVARVVAMDIASGELDPLKRNVAVATMRTALEVIPSFSTLLAAGRKRLGLVMGDYRDYATHYRVTLDPIDVEEG